MPRQCRIREERGETHRKEKRVFSAEASQKTLFPRAPHPQEKPSARIRFFSRSSVRFFCRFLQKSFFIFAAWYLCVLPFGVKKNAFALASGPASVQGGPLLLSYPIIRILSRHLVEMFKQKTRGPAGTDVSPAGEIRSLRAGACCPHPAAWVAARSGDRALRGLRRRTWEIPRQARHDSAGAG